MTDAIRLAKDDESGEPRAERDIAQRLMKQRTILLAKEITRDSASKVVAQLLLLSAESPDEPIRMFINSPGGDVDAGFAIFDIVRYIAAPVHMIVAGLAASAAVLVLVASPRERRFSLPNARFLIHQPSTGVRGAAADIQIEATEILKSRDRINRLLAEETGKSVEEIDRDTRRNYWMDAEQALKYGLVSKVIARAEDAK